MLKSNYSSEAVVRSMYQLHSRGHCWSIRSSHHVIYNYATTLYLWENLKFARTPSRWDHFCSPDVFGRIDVFRVTRASSPCQNKMCCMCYRPISLCTNSRIESIRDHHSIDPTTSDRHYHSAAQSPKIVKFYIKCMFLYYANICFCMYSCHDYVSCLFHALLINIQRRGSPLQCLRSQWSIRHCIFSALSFDCIDHSNFQYSIFTIFLSLNEFWSPFGSCAWHLHHCIFLNQLEETSSTDVFVPTLDLDRRRLNPNLNQSQTVHVTDIQK